MYCLYSYLKCFNFFIPRSASFSSVNTGEGFQGSNSQSRLGNSLLVDRGFPFLQEGWGGSGYIINHSVVEFIIFILLQIVGIYAFRLFLLCHICVYFVTCLHVFCCLIAFISILHAHLCLGVFITLYMPVLCKSVKSTIDLALHCCS